MIEAAKIPIHLGGEPLGVAIDRARKGTT